jgi:hypothetical protein
MSKERCIASVDLAAEVCVEVACKLAGRFILPALNVIDRSSQGVLKLGQTNAPLRCVTLLGCLRGLRPRRHEPEQKETN